MTSYSDVEPFMITTDANSNKNLSSQLFTFPQAGVAVSAGSYQLRSYSIPLSTDTRFYQVYVNLSIDGDFWSALPSRDRIYPSNRSIAMNLAQSGSDATLDVYFVNSSASNYTFPAMTVSIAKRDFVDEV